MTPFNEPRNDEGHSIFRVRSPVCLYATVESAIEYTVYSLVEQPGLELPDQFASPMNRDWVCCPEIRQVRTRG